MRAGKSLEKKIALDGEGWPGCLDNLPLRNPQWANKKMELASPSEAAEVAKHGFSRRNKGQGHGLTKGGAPYARLNALAAAAGYNTVRH